MRRVLAKTVVARCVVLACIAGVAVIACGRGRSAHGQESNPSRNPSRAVGESRPVPAFVVDVHLSARAREKLSASKESILVLAYFFGFPTQATRQYGGDMGEIHLGQDQIEMKQPGAARFAHSVYDSSKLWMLDKRRLKVLINVVSGRHSSRNNLLGCNIFEDDVERAAKVGVRIDCSLIGEEQPAGRSTHQRSRGSAESLREEVRLPGVGKVVWRVQFPTSGR